MNCQRCGESIPSGEEREYAGRMLCEDCYMDTLSPARTCDPWAVHSAKTLEMKGDASPEVTELQKKILRILQETGGVEPSILCERLNIKPSDLEREVAALRHMEKVRGALIDGRKVIRLW